MITEEEVRKLQKATITFTKVTNDYIEQRKEIDPTFKAPLLDWSSDIRIDPTGDILTLEWEEYHCGDAEGFDLWDPNWAQRVKEELEQASQKEQERREAERKAHEELERSLMRSLQKKYEGLR